MNAFLLFAVGGPVLILTNATYVCDPRLIKNLNRFGKFIGYELPIEAVKYMYAAHYEHVLTDPKQTDDFRILDTDAKQIFTNIDFRLLRQPMVHQP